MIRRFRWIEGGENYHFTYDADSVTVEVVPHITYATRLSREELDLLMHRYLENRNHFQGESAVIFRTYLQKRGIGLPQIPSP